MSSLRHAAGNTHVEVNSGGVDVIARAVKAATNPTEGQLMLQAGFKCAILGGESREQTSTTSDTEGNVRVDRVIERSTVSDGGKEILVQQVQQSAQQMAPMPDIEMAIKAELAAQMSKFVTKADFNDAIKQFEYALLANTTVMTNGMTTQTTTMLDGMKTQTTTMTDGMAVVADKLVNSGMHNVEVLKAYTEKYAVRMDDKIGQEEVRVDKNMADLEQKMLARNNKQRKIMDAKNLDNEATIKELRSKNIDNEATMKDLDSKTDKMINIMKKKMRAQNEAHNAKDAERDAKDQERDELIATLQCDRSNQKKRPADNQGEGSTKKKGGWSTVAKNISKKNGSNIFRWKKDIGNITHFENNFKTAEEASKAMAVYFQNMD